MSYLDCLPFSWLVGKVPTRVPINAFNENAILTESKSGRSEIGTLIDKFRLELAHAQLQEQLSRERFSVVYKKYFSTQPHAGVQAAGAAVFRAQQKANAYIQKLRRLEEVEHQQMLAGVGEETNKVLKRAMKAAKSRNFDGELEVMENTQDFMDDHADFHEQEVSMCTDNEMSDFVSNLCGETVEPVVVPQEPAIVTIESSASTGGASESTALLAPAKSKKVEESGSKKTDKSASVAALMVV